jgi:TetR/AcrR family transcriptional regulator, transcriptional repressor for nem operon
MKKSEQTRQFIIEKSAAVINKKGIAGTSITDLMEATKLAKGGIYGNFDSKEEISLEAFNYLAGKTSAALDAASTMGATPKERLLSLLKFYSDFCEPGKPGGCALLNFGTEADDTNPGLRQRVAKAVKRSQLRIQKLVEEGQASGDFRNQTDASVFALKMFTMIEGAHFTSRVTNSKEPMNTIHGLLKAEIESM